MIYNLCWQIKSTDQSTMAGQAAFTSTAIETLAPDREGELPRGLPLVSSKISALIRGFH